MPQLNSIDTNFNLPPTAGERVKLCHNKFQNVAWLELSNSDWIMKGSGDRFKTVYIGVYLAGNVLIPVDKNFAQNTHDSYLFVDKGTAQGGQQDSVAIFQKKIIDDWGKVNLATPVNAASPPVLRQRSDAVSGRAPPPVNAAPPPVLRQRSDAVSGRAPPPVNAAPISQGLVKPVMMPPPVAPPLPSILPLVSVLKAAYGEGNPGVAPSLFEQAKQCLERHMQPGPISGKWAGFDELAPNPGFCGKEDVLPPSNDYGKDHRTIPLVETKQKLPDFREKELHTSTGSINKIRYQYAYEIELKHPDAVYQDEVFQAGTNKRKVPRYPVVPSGPVKMVSAYGFRGEGREPDQIKEAGGLHPNYTRTDTLELINIYKDGEDQAKRILKLPDADQTEIDITALNLNMIPSVDESGKIRKDFRNNPIMKIHRQSLIAKIEDNPDEIFSNTGLLKTGFTDNAKGRSLALHLTYYVLQPQFGGYISLSRSYATAKRFATNVMHQMGWVYVCLGWGAVEVDTDIYPEQELAVPGGLDWDDVVGWRHVGIDDRFDGPIYLRSSLRQKDPLPYTEIYQLLSGKSQGGFRDQ